MLQPVPPAFSHLAGTGMVSLKFDEKMLEAKLDIPS
jgi:hypothetical protein